MRDNTHETDSPQHFIQQRIEHDQASQTYGGKVLTRFPPEPNGYLHIGHVKSICLNFDMAQRFGGGCNLRFDDTNPIKEEQAYVDAIQADVAWLGFQWSQLTYTSDQFERLYHFALQLIQAGDAYVCSLSPEEIRQYRGTLQEAGRPSPYRKRTVAENLTLFEAMRAGEYPEGTHVLRAKIDMTSGNMNMRDPVMYRIVHAHHHRTQDTWRIYPSYDFSHGTTDALEGITHSLCTLEFQDHRPLYEWFNERLFPEPRPQQIEFSRLNLSHTITSKRKLKRLIDEGHVESWDDPRLPTIAGLRRRGFTPQALQNFCEMIGISKSDSVIDMSVLEECVRHDLNQSVYRAFAVIKPIKVILLNYPEDQIDMIELPNHPQEPDWGTRQVPFSRELYIERDDFMEEAPAKFHRLKPGGEVRLRFAYTIRCEKVIKDAAGEVIELHCNCDMKTFGRKPEGRKVKGIIHWVSARDNFPATVRLYDRLFKVENPDQYDDWEEMIARLNPTSLIQRANCFLEKSLVSAEPEQIFQFERLGYFIADRHDHRPEAPVFNRVVGLRDVWQLESPSMTKGGRSD